MILGKSDIGKLRLKTKLAEAKSVLETSQYPSQQEIAKKQLAMLQEEYKELTGEYATEFLIVTSINEEKIKSTADSKFLDKILGCLNNAKFYVDINKETGFITIKGDSDDEKVMLEYKY